MKIQKDFLNDTNSPCKIFNQNDLILQNVTILPQLYTLVYIKRNNYRIHLYMSKNEATNLLKNTNLTEKSGAL